MVGKNIIFKRIIKNCLETRNIENRKVCLKIAVVFFIKCILFDGENFMVRFNAKYIQSFPERVCDWIRYLLMQIYRFYLVKFASSEQRTLRRYEFINVGVGLPLHLKVCDTPDELYIDMLLKDCGLFLVEEYFCGDDIIYDITISK